MKKLLIIFTLGLIFGQDAITTKKFSMDIYEGEHTYDLLELTGVDGIKIITISDLLPIGNNVSYHEEYP